MGTTVFPKPLDQDVSGKQNSTDNNLNTTAKTIVGAINEHETDIIAINGKISTKELTDGSLSSIESQIVTLVGTLSANEIVKVKFTLTSASDPFDAISYIGMVSKFSNAYFAVNVQGAYATVFIQGAYRNGTWTWNDINSKIATLGTEITVTKNDTYVSNDFNFACRKIDSKVLVFDGYMTLSDNVPAYSTLAAFTGITTSRACRMIAVDQENKAHQIYIPNASNAIITREYIPSGTNLYFSGTIII